MNEKHRRGIKGKTGIVFLVVVMIMVFTPHSPNILAAQIVASGTCGEHGDNVAWRLDTEGTLTIFGTGAMEEYGYDEGNQSPPWWEYWSSVKSVVIEEGVSYISGFANIETLENVIISNSVIGMGVSTFENCETLTNVTLSKNLTEVQDKAFCNCKALTNIEIPDSVTRIRGSAFYNCQSLTDVTLPKNLLEIWEDAFQGCIALKNIEIPDNVTRIVVSGTCGANGDNVTWKLDKKGTLTISGTGAMEEYGYYLSDKPSPWSQYQYRSSINSIVIEEGVSYISGFGDITWLENVVISDSVTSIGNRAFSYCIYLANIEIPDSVTSIGDNAFSYCKALKSIEIPDSVTSIGHSAFKNCELLTNVTFSKKLVKIENDTFYNCKALKNIEIPNSVISIGGAAFGNCKSLINVILSKNLTEIWEDAFEGCESLKNIEIPDSIKKIVDYGNCGANGDNVTWKLDEEGTLTISGTGSMGKYTSNFMGTPSPWLKYRSSIKSIVIEEGVSSINSGFGNIETLKKVVIPDSVTSIGNSAFENCGSLTDVTFSKNLTEIGDNTFAGCKALTHIEIPDSVTSIGNSAFENCESLADVTLSKNLTEIQYQTFCDCKALKGIEIPNSVTSIGGSAFKNCESLKNVSFPNNLTSIEGSAFYNCKTLISIKIPDSVTSIGKYAFENCESLTDVSLSNNLTEIKDCTFYGCNAIKEVKIPDSVTSIGSHAFKCAGLTVITIPKSITYIAGNQAPAFGVPASAVFMVSKPSEAYNWVLRNGRCFKIIDSPITVTFDSNGGSPVSPVYDVTGNSTISAPAEPQREGYIFAGWFDYNDGDFCPNDEFTYHQSSWRGFEEKITESVTLYAHWLRNSFTVTFNSNGGSAVPAVTNITRGSKISKPNDPVKKGYIFGGWEYESSKYFSSSLYGIWGDFSDEIHDDITLKAKWTKNTAKLPKIKTITEGHTYLLKISSNAPVSKVKWTSSNQKVIKVTKAKKTSVRIKGIRKKKKATLKAVVTFKDGSTQTIKQTINVKGKIKYPSYASYPKGIQPFDEKVGAYDRGRYSNGEYSYYVLSGLTYKISQYHYYLLGKDYRLKKDYYSNPTLRVFVYAKGAVKVEMEVLQTAVGQGVVNITWNTKKKKK